MAWRTFPVTFGDTFQIPVTATWPPAWLWRDQVPPGKVYLFQSLNLQLFVDEQWARHVVWHHFLHPDGINSGPMTIPPWRYPYTSSQNKGDYSNAENHYIGQFYSAGQGVSFATINFSPSLQWMYMSALWAIGESYDVIPLQHGDTATFAGQLAEAEPMEPVLITGDTVQRAMREVSVEVPPGMQPVLDLHRREAERHEREYNRPLRRLGRWLGF